MTVRPFEFSEFPRRLEVAYTQLIDVWREDMNRNSIGIPPEVLSVLTGSDIRSEAKLADGSPLPYWIKFDQDARALLVDPPKDLQHRSVTVKILFWDEKGNEAVAAITLNMDKDAIREQGQSGAQDYHAETENRVSARPGENADLSLALEKQHTQVLTGKEITITATLADGSPLPEGLKMDPRTGEITGKVQVGAEESQLEIRVMAVDELGHRSVVIHHVRVAPTPGDGAHLDMPAPVARPSFTAQLAACLLV